MMAAAPDNSAGGTLAGNGDLGRTAITLEQQGLVQQAGTGSLRVVKRGRKFGGRESSPFGVMEIRHINFANLVHSVRAPCPPCPSLVELTSSPRRHLIIPHPWRA